MGRNGVAGRPFAHDLRDQIEAAGYDFVIFDMSPGVHVGKSIIAIADEVIPIVRQNISVLTVWKSLIHYEHPERIALKSYRQQTDSEWY